ncbi:hypothetical protein R3P38DRAFT_3141396 [Favolaschia claudopus]|uniref:F-box domain-containing protein n=1 Tax=Favolaschia claudopus TaxID=2862362 RepID=A0AAV9Z601_9AGAR
MVTTRRAATAAKSIIRWLPNEVLTTIAQYLLVPDLHALCLTSRLFRNIVAPFLYRSVQLSDVFRLKIFLHTMMQRSGASLYRHVHDFCAPDSKDQSGTHASYTPRIVKHLTTVLLNFSNLQMLNILVTEPMAFTDLLERAHFPHLIMFLYTVHSDTAGPLVAFLNRHPTITHLALLLNERVELPGSVVMPRLISLNLPNHCFPSFVLSGLALESVSIVVFPFEVEDGNLSPTFLQLQGMTSLTHVLIHSIVAHLDDTTTLEALAAHLPQLHRITIRRGGCGPANISWATALELATQLGKFKSLWFLELHSLLDESCDVKKALRLWGDACRCLIMVTLNKDNWEWGMTGGKEVEWVLSSNATSESR